MEGGEAFSDDPAPRAASSPPLGDTRVTAAPAGARCAAPRRCWAAPAASPLPTGAAAPLTRRFAAAWRGRNGRGKGGGSGTTGGKKPGRVRRAGGGARPLPPSGARTGPSRPRERALTSPLRHFAYQPLSLSPLGGDRVSFASPPGAQPMALRVRRPPAGGRDGSGQGRMRRCVRRCCWRRSPPPPPPARPGLGWAGLGLGLGWAARGWAPGRGKKGKRAGVAASPFPAIAESRARLPAAPSPAEPPLAGPPSDRIDLGLGDLFIFWFIIYFFFSGGGAVGEQLLHGRQ